MLSKILSTQYIIIFVTAITTGCVSVGVEEPSVERASDVHYASPQNFERFEQNHLDAAWRNNNNGNTISYLSECKGSSDPTHEAIRDGIITGLTDSSVLKQKMIPFNNRQALQSSISGTVDGIKTQFEIIILKKNNCIYVLTYVGLEKQFTKNKANFDKFVLEFKAP